MRFRIAIFIVTVQFLLFLAHLAVYRAWLAFWGAPNPDGLAVLRIAFALLSVSFVLASALAFRYSNALVRGFYTLAAVWLGAPQNASHARYTAR